MKQFLCMAAGLFAAAVTAQDFQGIAVYQSKTKMTVTTTGDGPNMDEAMIAELAKLTEKTFTLAFNKTESIYEEEVKLESPTVMVGGFNLNMGGGRLYKNLKDRVYLNETEMMDKQFLITDSLGTYQWTLTNETKKIGDYTCYKATYTIAAVPLTKEEEENEKSLFGSVTQPKDVVITAWYTQQIPVSHGPGNYWGLPGLILEVNDGGTTLVCSKITLNPKDKVEIKKPKKGEKVSREEYDAIMAKKFEEMNEMNRPAASGGNSNVRATTIRIGG